MPKEANSKLNVIIDEVIHKSNAQNKVLKKMLSQLKKDSIQLKAESIIMNDDNKDEFKEHK